MQIKENTSIHPGKISLGNGRYAVVENLARHNNRSFRANKLVIVFPNCK